MNVYWQSVRRGQNLLFSDDESGREERIGGFRQTNQGIDAYAATFGYDPGRSQKGFPTIEAAKVFVESFKPWELYGAQGVTVETEVRPASESAAPVSVETSDPTATAIAPEPQSVPTASQPKTRERWWEFWKRS